MAKSKSAKRPASLSDMPMPTMASRPSVADRKRERQYAAQSAMDTLMRAEDHKKNPRLMSDVRKLAAEHAAKMSRIAKK